MRYLLLAGICGLVLSSCATRFHSTPAYLDTRLDEITEPALTPFKNDYEFKQYIKLLKSKARQRDEWWAINENASPYIQYAQVDECMDDSCMDDEIVVTTGSRASSSSSSVSVSAVSGTSVTNTQKQGVDEGDIVKLYKNYMIVMQDGRLFTVDIGAGKGDMRRVDRADIYPDEAHNAWYDEVVLHDNIIVIAGYSYKQDATELVIFRIGEDGRLSRKGRYHISSGDYYDTENYATRMVNNNLVMYTPVNMRNMLENDNLRFPLVRRWRPDLPEDYEDDPSIRNLIDARQIYKPVQRTSDPTIHTISVCPLGDDAGQAKLDCNSQAIIAPSSYTYYVSRSHAYLWVNNDSGNLAHNKNTQDCAAGAVPRYSEGPTSFVYAVPIKGGQVKAMQTYGRPNNQFSLETTDEEFRAILDYDHVNCDDNDDKGYVKYFSAPLSAFRAAPPKMHASNYVDLPSIEGRNYEARFTEDYLVYGTEFNGRWHRPIVSTKGVRAGKIYAVPTDDPKNVTVMDAPHNTIRAERVADNMVLTGYGAQSGLYVSMVDLSAKPNVSSTIVLEDRFETEGRSHAFNAITSADGSGLMGLPTGIRTEGNRYWWRSTESDVSFMSISSDAQINSVGTLKATPDSEHPDYDCEVSCVDWYGNSRPIFIEGRVFALSETEVIEGEIIGDQIRDAGRVNLTKPFIQSVSGLSGVNGANP